MHPYLNSGYRNFGGVYFNTLEPQNVIPPIVSVFVAPAAPPNQEFPYWFARRGRGRGRGVRGRAGGRGGNMGGAFAGPPFVPDADEGDFVMTEDANAEYIVRRNQQPPASPPADAMEQLIHQMSPDGEIVGSYRGFNDPYHAMEHMRDYEVMRETEVLRDIEDAEVEARWDMMLERQNERRMLQSQIDRQAARAEYKERQAAAIAAYQARLREQEAESQAERALAARQQDEDRVGYDDQYEHEKWVIIERYGMLALKGWQPTKRALYITNANIMKFFQDQDPKGSFEFREADFRAIHDAFHDFGMVRMFGPELQSDGSTRTVIRTTSGAKLVFSSPTQFAATATS